MKDAYSFDLDDEGLRESYARHRAAYRRVFDRFRAGPHGGAGGLRDDGRVGLGGVPGHHPGR